MRGRTARRTRVAANALAAGLAIAAVVASPAAAAPPALTPLTASVLAPPQPAAATDGRRHLVYEVLLQSRAGVPLVVRSVAVRSRSGRGLLTLTGRRVATALTDGQDQPTTALEPYQGATLWVDLPVRRHQPAPDALRHRLRLRAVLPAPSPPVDLTVDVARTRVIHRAMTVVGAPLHGGGLIDVNGCCGLSPHRTGINAIDGTPYLSQRFAIDFLRIDRQGRAFTGDVTRNASFIGFRDPVFSTTAGRVVETRGDLPENTPPEEPSPETFTAQTALGNHVVVRLARNRYALYAHLHTGSLQVRRGDRVRAGQMLGRVGNTGASGAPHLHFHLSDGPQPLASNGLPVAFRSFRVPGTVTNLDGFLAGESPAAIAPTRGSAARDGRMPVQAAVLDFG
jgi:hypothetical protein